MQIFNRNTVRSSTKFIPGSCRHPLLPACPEQPSPARQSPPWWRGFPPLPIKCPSGQTSPFLPSMSFVARQHVGKATPLHILPDRLSSYHGMYANIKYADNISHQSLDAYTVALINQLKINNPPTSNRKNVPSFNNLTKQKTLAALKRQ